MTWITVCIPGSMELNGIIYSITRGARKICVRTMGLLHPSVLICIRTAYIVGNMRERLTRTCDAGAESIT